MNWQSQALALLTASLVRPLVLAAAAWLILSVLRVRHPASRHAVWAAVLVGMLLLPVASVIAPHWKLPVLPARVLAARTLPAKFTRAANRLRRAIAPHWKLPLLHRLLPRREDAATQTPLLANDMSYYDFSGFATGAVPSAIPAPVTHPAKVFKLAAPRKMLLWCYLAGVLAMAAYRLTGWMMLARVMSRSKAVRLRKLRKLRESADILTPVTVGILRPSVILPAGWLSWNTGTKRAVLAHEFAHIRRGDRWISFLTRLAKCVYWFHPLAWWVSRQIADLAELSCDAVVLEKNRDPGGYSRILLGFAETVNAAGYRAALPGLAIASRSGMGHRIDQVFELASGNLRRLSRPKAVLALMGFPVVCIAATVGLTAQAPHRAPQPVLLAQLQRPAAAQPVAAPSPKFDVVSVRRCNPNGLPGPGSGEGGGRGTGAQYSPGRIRMQCMTVGAMMNAAYLGQLGEGESLLNYMPSIGDDNWLRKAPGWVNSDLYSVEGKTDNPAAKASDGRGRGSGDRVLERMLQVALEDRFQLKLHQETEDVPMYNLTVAKGGLKLKPMQPGGCSAPDPARIPAPRGIFITGDWSPDGKTMPCMIVLHTAGPDWGLDAGGQTAGNLVGMLAKVLDRHVFDKTGITDVYTFHLRFAHDGSTPGNLPAQTTERMFAHSDVPSGASIFTVLEGVGLKLEPTRGPQGHYVIDHVERPSEN